MLDTFFLGWDWMAGTINRRIGKTGASGVATWAIERALRIVIDSQGSEFSAGILAAAKFYRERGFVVKTA
jgi:hypothetical protein